MFCFLYLALYTSVCWSLRSIVLFWEDVLCSLLPLCHLVWGSWLGQCIYKLPYHHFCKLSLPSHHGEQWDTDSEIVETTQPHSNLSSSSTPNSNWLNLFILWALLIHVVLESIRKVNFIGKLSLFLEWDHLMILLILGKYNQPKLTQEEQ